MDDQGLVGILHREADSTEQPQAFGDRQSVSIAIFVDTNALDVLHNEIGQSFFSAPTIKEPYDAGVVQGCQGLSLVAETPEDFILVRSRLQHLDGDALDKFARAMLFAFIDDAHAALKNFAGDLVAKFILDCEKWHMWMVENCPLKSSPAVSGN